MEGQTKAEEKKLTAKNISKAFKFIAPAGAIICVILLWVGVFKNATIGEICALWATVYGLGAGTIDANIIIDKYTGVKNWNTSAIYADPSIVAGTKKSE